MALQRRTLRINKAPLFETFGSLKIKNSGYTPSCLQLMRKSMYSLSLFCFYFNFSYLWKSLTLTFPCVRAISMYMLMMFLDSTKYKSVWKKKKFKTTRSSHTMTFFKLTDWYKISDIYINHNNWQVLSLSFSSIIFIISDTNCRHLLLS